MCDRIKRVISIDIGSTNSQIAQCYQRSTDNGQTWEIANKDQKAAQNCILQENCEYDIPSIIVTQNDVPQNLLGRINFGSMGFLIGNKASKVFHENQGIMPRIEFKKDFFCSNEELSDNVAKEKFDRARESIFYMLKFMKEKAAGTKQEFLNRPPDRPVEEETIITVPLRATDHERSTMRDLAETVGFKEVKIRDEATAVLRYALTEPNFSLRQKVENLTTQQKLTVLIVDVGGSTTDILLVEIGPNGQGGFTIDERGRWPKIGEKNTLGGIDVDKKICEWLLHKSYLLPDLVENEIKYHGYDLFRELKNDISDCFNFNEDMEIVELKNVGYLSEDRRHRDRRCWRFSDKFYPENGAINAQIFLKEIAGDYLRNLNTAIRAVLKSGDIDEGDIDCIVSSGGGAKIFGISKLLKGETLPTVDEPLRFTKVFATNRMYIENTEISSALCAIGGAWPLANIKFRNACPCDYSFCLNVYFANNNTAKQYDDKIYETTPPDMNNFMRALQDIEMDFVKKDAPLPIDPFQTTYVVRNLFVQDGQVFILVFNVYSRSEDGEKHFQKGWSISSERTWLNATNQLLRRIVNAVANIWSPQTKANATFSITINVTEDFMIKITPQIQIAGQTLNLHVLTTN